MKKEEKERQLAEAAKRRAETAKVPEPPPKATRRPDLTSLQVPRVRLVRGSQQEQDRLATQAMLDAWQTPDGWKCPRCPYSTTNADDFLEHLETEINQAMTKVAGIGSHGRKPPPRE
ncbi:hypothetical protein ES708_04852 [subsurface metagenome]